MKSVLIAFIFLGLILSISAQTTYPATSSVTDRFLHHACKEENGCGTTITKTSSYNPFRQRPKVVTQDAEVLAMAAIRKIFKATFNRDAVDDYVLKEAKSFVQKGYPRDKHAEEMLRAAYKKNPSLYVKYAKKVSTSNQGYSKYGTMKLSGSSIFSSGGAVGVSLG